MILLIDGDIIACRAAGACKPGEPLENALHNAKQLLLRTLTDLYCGDYKMFLTGWKDETNFRKVLYPDYKAHRSAKPEHTIAVRKYLMDYHGAKEILGMEADDALAIEQYTNYYNNSLGDEACDSCICSIDKDLHMVPGYHYNIAKREQIWISQLDGLKNFYKQLLRGDACDNIPRIKKFWKEKDYTTTITACESELDMLLCALEEVEKVLPDEDPEEVLKFRGELLWLKTSELDSWTARMQSLLYPMLN